MGYTKQTRSLSLNLVLVLPMLVVYEIWLMVSRPKVVNMAGSMAKLPLEYASEIFKKFGNNSYLTGSIMFNSMVITFLVIAYFRTRQKNELTPGLFVPMLLESGVYGFFLGHVVTALMNILQSIPSKFSAISMAPVTNSFDSIMLSIGAGVYEELVFRLLLVGGLCWVGHIIFSKNKWGLMIALILTLSTLFAAVEKILEPMFIFSWGNLIGGMLFKIPFYTGFGVLVFSVFCFLIWTLQKLRMKPGWAIGMVSVVIGSLLFSAFHHWGPLGEPFVANVFVFRFVAGLVLSTIYQARGLGIAVYTHGIYDILVALAV